MPRTVHINEVAAEKKFCPFMHNMNPHAYVGGTAYRENKTNRCVGAECMMWRETDPKDRVGFCGLAGLYQNEGEIKST